MSEIQEFRERCGKAMGWSLIKSTVYPHASEWHSGGGYTEEFWKGSVDPVYSPSPLKSGSWKPDTDYNQAMMMRDRAADVTHDPRFARGYKFKMALACLPDIMDACDDLPYNEMVMATARQISEAALQVLESEAKKEAKELESCPNNEEA